MPTVPQRMAFDHLLSHDNAALFLGCGLGKTAVALHAQVELMMSGLSKGALVVAPLRVCNLTWPAEVERWDLPAQVGIHNLRTKDGCRAFSRGVEGIYVVNYEMLRVCAARWREFPKMPFDTVIFDELTRAKNHRSVNINAIRPLLRRFCKRKWGLTGTPAPNGLLDLFAQVRLLDDGERLGKNYTAFRQCYFQQDDYMGYSWSPRGGSRERIYRRISDIALTLKSSDWLDIPDTILEDISVPFGDANIEKGYKALEKDLLLPLKNGEEVTAPNAAVLVNKLLQYTSGAIYDEERNWHLLHTKKMEALLGLVKSLKGEPLIVFYQYKHELERLRGCAELGVTAFSDAKTIQQQEGLIARWNKGEIRVLAAHPKSMAHGLNLQDGGSKVAWLTPTWSREDYDQAIARVARKGQDKVTTVYRLLTSETVDDAVVEALRCKDEEQSALLNALRRYAA